jgi:nucleotide-binding universal stress UspA family protein
MNTIVVGVDGSTGSRAALRFATQEARLRGASLRIVTAWQMPVLAFSGGFIPADLPMEFERAAEDASRQSLEWLGEAGSGVHIERVVEEGQAAHVLVEAAKGAKLLVVGSRGRGGFTGLVLGSVSQQCVQHAPCPVVVVTEAARDEAVAA